MPKARSREIAAQSPGKQQSLQEKAAAKSLTSLHGEKSPSNSVTPVAQCCWHQLSSPAQCTRWPLVLDTFPRSCTAPLLRASWPGSCCSRRPRREQAWAAGSPCPGGSAGSQHPFSETAASSVTGSCWIAAAAMLMASSRLCCSSS